MTIEFKIPNGSMRINAETFFKEAPKMKIRKMLKCLRDSDPTVENVHKIKDWLQEEIDNEKHRQKDFSVKHFSEKEQLQALSRYLEYFKTFCDDKEKVEEAKKDVRNCKMRMRTALTRANNAEKLAEKYKSILEDACKILN